MLGPVLFFYLHKGGLTLNDIFDEIFGEPKRIQRKPGPAENVEAIENPDDFWEPITKMSEEATIKAHEGYLAAEKQEARKKWAVGASLIGAFSLAISGIVYLGQDKQPTQPASPEKQSLPVKPPAP